MKKTLAIVLALVLVLCAAVALADAAVIGKYQGNGNGTHKYILEFDKEGKPATWTNMACTLAPDSKDKRNEKETTVAMNELSHETTVITKTYGKCKDCRQTLDVPQTSESVKIAAHTWVRGAWVNRIDANPVICHNDVTHVAKYDVYEAVCSVCGHKTVSYKVPVYQEHDFRLKKTGIADNGSKTYSNQKGQKCKDCGYTRAYKMLTTAAGQKVEEIIAAFEAAGATVEFDADQMIAIGVEEGEVGEVEGCGVSTIQFSNFSAIDKDNQNEVKTDNDAYAYNDYIDKNGKHVKSYTDSTKSTVEGNAYTQTPATALAKYAWNTHKSTGDTKNINQITKSYNAAYVTMYVDGVAHRVYFYERHDGNGWVYAFEADMYGEAVDVKMANTYIDNMGNEVEYPVDKSYLFRSGAGNEYATTAYDLNGNGKKVTSVAAGKTIKSIGVAYEGSDKNKYNQQVGSDTLMKRKVDGHWVNTVWAYEMLDDFVFVANGYIVY